MKNQKIVILGASGFAGSGVFDFLCKKNYEVIGLGRKKNPWRIDNKYLNNYFSTQDQDILEVLNKLKPRVLINFTASGAYSFQNNFENIVGTNLILLEKISQWAIENDALIIQAGTSSEYGLNSAGPKEDATPIPNSLYSITKLAGTQLLGHYFSKGLNSIVLRLYSVYGPREDSSRLIPAVIRGIIKSDWPNFTNPNISRDFIYVDDISDLILKILDRFFLNPERVFEIYNVGSGKKTTMQDLIEILMSNFGMPEPKAEIYPPRKWDIENWYSNIEKVTTDFEWSPKSNLISGLNEMKEWYLRGNNIDYLGYEYSENK